MTANPYEIERDRPKHNENSDTGSPVVVPIRMLVYERHQNPDLFKPIHIPVERDGVMP